MVRCPSPKSDQHCGQFRLDEVLAAMIMVAVWEMLIGVRWTSPWNYKVRFCWFLLPFMEGGTVILAEQEILTLSCRMNGAYRFTSVYSWLNIL